MKRQMTCCRKHRSKYLDNEEKYMPDTNFKGWVYTIMPEYIYQ